MQIVLMVPAVVFVLIVLIVPNVSAIFPDVPVIIAQSAFIFSQVGPGCSRGGRVTFDAIGLDRRAVFSHVASVSRAVSHVLAHIPVILANVLAVGTTIRVRRAPSCACSRVRMR